MSAPQPRIRVLVVDDSSIVRKVVGQVLAAEADIEVVGYAVDGREALQKIGDLKPQVVTLDIEMPQLDGLQTLRALKERPVQPRVIMFSTLTQRGAAMTLDALALGAADYVAKPETARTLDDAMKAVASELLPKVRALASRHMGGHAAAPSDKPAAAAPVAAPALPPAANARIDMVAIGSSTGGPNALVELIKRLPESFPVPLVVVQHMPPVFTKMLAERLTQQSLLKVAEAEHGMSLTSGHIYIAPGGHHLEVERSGSELRAKTHDGAPENHCRPAVDVLLRSATRALGPGVLTVVLTGMGQDGLRGAELVRRAGGTVLVQDERSSVVWGMPGNIARAGLASGVHDVAGLATEVVRRVLRDRAGTARSPARVGR